MIVARARARRLTLALSLTLLAAAPALAQVRPPVLTSISPYGHQRGTTADFVLEGANLADADTVLFTDEGLSALITGYEDLGPDVRKRMPGETGAIIQDRARKARVRLRITAAGTVPAGRHGLRIHTPLGTTSFRPLWVGNEPERREPEPNDEAAAAPGVVAPLTINGVLSEAGDVDHVRVPVRSGRSLVVSVLAAPLGSQVDATLTLLDDKGRELASNDDFQGRRDPLLVYDPPADGQVVVRVGDALNGGGDRHIYRLTVGELPYLTRAFPLGVPAAGAPEIAIEGANLGEVRRARVGTPLPDRPDRAPVEPSGLPSAPLNRLTVAVGRHPEVLEVEANDTIGGAQPVTLPVTINGTVKGDETSDLDHFRFRARKGEPLVLEVEAERLGSPLDSVIEVLDLSGQPVPRAVLRPVWETTVDLRNHSSTQTGLRLLAWSQLRRGDLVYVDRELLRVDELPKGPDEDTFFVQFRGRRVAFEDTTPEGHALLQPVYKVERHPPGSTFSPNGLPLFELHYRNDDGGPLAGRDSHLTFIPPADGEYVVRLADTRGEHGPAFAYRLTLAPARPDFELFVSPSNPNVPVGGRIPITVFAWRHGGFDGPIEVSLTDLPPGLSSTSGTLLPGENVVTLTLAADPAAGARLAPFVVEGAASIGGKSIVRAARPDEPINVIAITSPPDVRVVLVTPEVIELAPGERTRVTATIERANGFEGRVPLSVNNLPLRVTVPDIGLNGILITEEQVSRSFEIVADEHAEPLEQTLYVTARVETNGGTSSQHSSRPIKIRIAGKATSR